MLADNGNPRFPWNPPVEPSGVPLQLTELGEGRCARIHLADLESDEWALLRALGLSQKSRLRICKAGNPWIVQVRETRIGLAAAVAERILVIPEAEA